MQKVRPVPLPEYHEPDHQPTPGSELYHKMTKPARAIFYLVVIIGRLFGQNAMKYDEKNGKIEFKLFSCSSLFTLIRLVVFNFPFILAPAMIHFGGFKDEEWENFVDSRNGTFENATVPGQPKTREIVQSIEYFSNFSYYVLPFVLPYFMTQPLNRLVEISKWERKFMKRKAFHN